MMLHMMLLYPHSLEQTYLPHHTAADAHACMLMRATFCRLTLGLTSWQGHWSRWRNSIQRILLRGAASPACLACLPRLPASPPLPSPSHPIPSPALPCLPACLPACLRINRKWEGCWNITRYFMLKHNSLCSPF